MLPSDASLSSDADVRDSESDGRGAKDWMLVDKGLLGILKPGGDRRATFLVPGHHVSLRACEAMTNKGD